METAMTRPPALERLAFDPVCGSPLPPLYGANPFCDGGYTYYFCSAMCRRFFIDQRDAKPALREVPRHATGSPQIDS
jgi:YHS domain-containing protein